MPQVLLSKTDYLLYRECPKNTWLKKNKPDLYYSKQLSDFEKSIIETGNEVEEAARKLFPTGILIEDRTAESQKLTADYIARKEKTLFQPAFEKDGFFAAVDLLKYDEKTDSYAICEIKASNQIKEKLHLYDLAFQVNLLKKVGLKVGKIELLHLNSKYIRSGELEITKLFVTDDVTEDVTAILESISADMDRALAYVRNENEPNGPCNCIYKGRSAHCTTFSYSNPHVPDYSVHDIVRIGLSKTKLTELIDSSIYELENVPESIELSEIQMNQVNTHITRRPITHFDKIAEEFRSLIFPLYFLDYETFPCAIPRFDGFSPYQQIPFQYSLHTLEKAGADPVHSEFLHMGSDDPSHAFARSLARDIGKIGAVIVWNKKFECGRNDELAKRIPDMRPFLQDVNARTYDLMDIFTKQYHVRHDYFGSTSIKYILKALLPELSYADLNIREGGTASQKWNEVVTDSTPADLKRLIGDDLLKYCERDTYAMYAIWKYLYDRISPQ